MSVGRIRFGRYGGELGLWACRVCANRVNRHYYTGTQVSPVVINKDIADDPDAGSHLRHRLTRRRPS